MAKTFVRISLATKFRVLFAAAVLGIIAAALAVPWYFMERLMDEAAERSASQLAHLYLAEWKQRHQVKPRPDSAIAGYFSEWGEGRRGPEFLTLTGEAPLPADSAVRRALKAFRKDPERRMALLGELDERGERVFRCFRPVRATADCRRCHDGVGAPAFQPDQLVGLIDMTVPRAPGALVWWTRGIFLTGGVLAAVLAFVVFYLITQQIILSPLRKLGALAEKVAEGDLTQRVTLTTGDEFERLGRRFNEMLDGIQTQQDRLRKANRALDLRLGELSEANVALYEANRIKNEFLANVSHELRTPLNSIIGFAELLGETDDERRRRYAHNILSSARMLLGIINDLLDLARIEAGKAEVRMEKVALGDLCETLCQLVRPIADKNRLHLEVDIAPDLPVVRTDAGKVRQILYNLLSNALKFTPPDGRVTLSARRVGAGSSPLRRESVAVSVADTGPGIAAADHQRIFEKFHRLDNPLTGEHGGAGLGLAIARELTGLLGGRLELDSEPGHGATFTVVLPVEPPEPPAVSTTRSR